MKKILSLFLTVGFIVGSFFVLFQKDAAVYAGLISNSVVKINSSTANGPTTPSGSEYGTSVANIGDLNDDGVDDILVGDYSSDDGGADRGKVWIHFMNVDGSIDSSVAINSSTTNGPTTLSNFAAYGSGVAGLGDLDGDGVEDIAVGARVDFDGVGQTGAVYIHFMNTDGSIDSTVRINKDTVNGPTTLAGGGFGASVANIGDLTGDGVIDIAVGSENESSSGSATGALFILALDTDGSVKSTVKINSNTTNGPTDLVANVAYGSDVANIGDLNDDGVEDLLVGARNDSENGTGRGSAYIHFMNTDGSIDSTVKINGDTANGPTLNANSFEYGSGIAGLGDLDGDGVEDIAVGAQGYSSSAGKIFIHFMNTDGTIRRTADMTSANQTGLVGPSQYGKAIVNMGDIDSDGFIDLAVGNPGGTSFFIHYLDLLPDIFVIETGGGNAVTEGGTTDTISVVLDFVVPTDDVVVTLTPDSQLSLDKTTLTFTAANWDTPQEVTITAINDSVVEGDHTGAISYSVASGDSNYDGYSISNTTVNITDDDNGIVYSIAFDWGGFDVSEDGDFNLVGVVLTAQPTDNVVVTLSPDSQLELDITEFTFTDANWDTPQEAFVTAVDDSDIEGYHSGVISSTSVSADLNFNNISIPDVTLTIKDNDVGVVISQTSNSTDVAEGGATDTFGVVMSTLPTNDVTVTITNDSQIELSSNVLTFTTANWDTVQNVTVTAVDDSDIEGNHTSLVSFTTTSDDANYEALTLSDITVNITDNDSVTPPPSNPGSTSGYWISHIRVKDFAKQTENQLIDLEAIASVPVTHYEISNNPDFRDKNVYLRETLIKELYWDICKGLDQCQAGEHKIYARFFWNEKVIASNEISIEYVPAKECPEFKKFLRKGSKDNDPEEVKKAQEFLNQELGVSLDIDGIFGKLTDRAVRDFQRKYPAEIISPWKNLDGPTGFWYITTRAFANKLSGC